MLAELARVHDGPSRDGGNRPFISGFPAANAVVPGAALNTSECLIAIGACGFTMGNEGADAVPGDGEGPVRPVLLDSFSIGATTLTNRAFGDFVRATRYVTDAERLGSSFVFYLQVSLEHRRHLPQVFPAGC